MKPLAVALPLLGGIGAVLAVFSYSGSFSTKPPAAPAWQETQAEPPLPEVQAVPRPQAQVSMPLVEFTKLYNSIEQLADEAEVVIEGTALDSTPIPYRESESSERTVSLTKVRVQVTKSFSDGIKRGDVLTVVEAGGFNTKQGLGLGEKFNLPPEELSEVVDVQMDGIPVMSQGDRVLLFLSQARTVHYLDEPFYGILGMYQGKFHIQDQEGRVFRSVSQYDEAISKDLATPKTDAEALIQTHIQAKKGSVQRQSLFPCCSQSLIKTRATKKAPSNERAFFRAVLKASSKPEPPKGPRLLTEPCFHPSPYAGRYPFSTESRMNSCANAQRRSEPWPMCALRSNTLSSVMPCVCHTTPSVW
ncbi:hypothetical protein EL26_02775 [Tumebacillus flagellatus]|uniref:Uncharacterized protein n=1 Tax=Tumebacillus flagellatus TaxID=1157490 RepID=A0A074LWG2_9BACL|nr:hypothetical protein EL26_02775 [Tumebacillus flagellatus]